jgi:hypothetical protein
MAGRELVGFFGERGVFGGLEWFLEVDGVVAWMKGVGGLERRG